MEMFTGEEQTAVSNAVPEVYKSGVLTDDTEEHLAYLAESLLEILKTTRSPKQRKYLVQDFLAMAVTSGLLIANRRMALMSMMYRNNTGLDN